MAGRRRNSKSSRRTPADPASPNRALRNPRAHAGPAAQPETGLEHGHGRVVIDLFRVDGLDEREPVRNLRGVRQQFAHPCAGLPRCSN